MVSTKQKLSMKKVMISVCLALMGYLGFSQNEAIDPSWFIGKWYQYSEVQCGDSIGWVEFTEKEGMLSVNFGNSDKHRNIVYWKASDTYSFVMEEGDSLFLYSKNSMSSLSNGEKRDGERSLILIDSLGFTLAGYKGLMNSSQINKTQLAAFPKYYTRNNIQDREAVLRQKDEIEIVLPDGFRGMALIAYGQEDGQEVYYDKNGLAVLHVDTAGILATQYRACPDVYAKEKIAYRFESGSDDEEIMTLSMNCLGLLGGASDKEIVALGFDLDKPVIYGARFNPARDGVVNKGFGREIGGQVFSFEVVVLKDLLSKVFPNREAGEE